MMNAAALPTRALPAVTGAGVRLDPSANDTRTRIRELFELLEAHVPIRRRLLHAGDRVYQSGERFTNLHIVHSGLFKVISLPSDGREQVVSLQFKGDWLGFDGISVGRHRCEAVAMDVGEVWTVSYEALLAACAQEPRVMQILHRAMSREIARDRDALVSLCTLPANARVAQFLVDWARSLAERGLRADQIMLRMTRAEIGNHLGMTLETVSRALSRLARDGLICFGGTGRRDVMIPDAAVLEAFVQREASDDRTLQ